MESYHVYSKLEYLIFMSLENKRLLRINALSLMLMSVKSHKSV